MIGAATHRATRAGHARLRHAQRWQKPSGPKRCAYNSGNWPLYTHWDHRRTDLRTSLHANPVPSIPECGRDPRHGIQVRSFQRRHAAIALTATMSSPIAKWIVILAATRRALKAPRFGSEISLGKYAGANDKIHHEYLRAARRIPRFTTRHPHLNGSFSYTNASVVTSCYARCGPHGALPQLDDRDHEFACGRFDYDISFLPPPIRLTGPGALRISNFSSTPMRSKATSPPLLPAGISFLS